MSSAGTAASAVVLGSAASGSPVSMAQASTASRLGSESALETYRIAAMEEDISRRSFELVNEQYKQNSADVIRLRKFPADSDDAATTPTRSA